MKKIDLLLFAFFKEKIGKDQLSVSIQEGETVESLFKKVVQDYPAASYPIESLRFAVNGEYSGKEIPLKEGDEVVFIPPVSGG